MRLTLPVLVRRRMPARQDESQTDLYLPPACFGVCFSNSPSPEAEEHRDGQVFLVGGRPMPGIIPGAATPGPLARGYINEWTASAGTGAVIALDPRTGEQRWKFEVGDVTSSGVLTTFSDLLFTGGREGYFFAIDAGDGEMLWRTTLGAMIHNGPITCGVDGQQFVAVAAGNDLFVFALRAPTRP